MALTAADVRRSVSYPADFREIHAWLSGESLESEGEKGWTLVLADAFPIGWGKRTGGVLKNHYPKGLRR